MGLLQRTYRVWCLVVLLCVAGCPGAPPPMYPIRDPVRFVELLRVRDERFRTLRATGSVEQFGRQGRVRGNVTIFVERPDKLRVDTWAFGNVVMSVVSDGSRFAMLQGTRFLVGPARPCVARQLLGIALEGHQVVTILSGGAPVVGDRLSPPRWENGRYVVDVYGEGGTSERIEFELPSEQRRFPPERQTPRLRRVVLRDSQGVVAEMTYDNYRLVDGTPFPQRVRVEMPREQVDTQIRLDEVVPNYTIPPDPENPDVPPPDPFRLERPAGAQELRLEC